MREVLARALDALRAAGVKLEEGWPAGVKPAEQYETYLTLLYSVFAIGLRDDQLEGLRQRAANQDGSHRRGGRRPSRRRTATMRSPTVAAWGCGRSGRATSRRTTPS